MKEKSKSLETLHENIGSIKVPEPSVLMDERFKLMISEEKKKILAGEAVFESRKSSFLHISAAVYKIAAGISLFLLGWFGATLYGVHFTGNGQLTILNSEVVKLRETLVLSMIRQNSPVERIKAVNMVSEMGQADDNIILSLMATLENDNNDNVRLVALDALIPFADKPEVREGLIRAISKQTSPMVQLRLSEIMVALQEKRAVPEFKKILNNVDLNYNVRSKLSETVRILI